VARHLLFGHLTIDDTVLPDGRTAMGALGGNVLYATIGAHLWTDSAAMVSRLGRGYPAELLQRMVDAGLCVDGLVPTEHPRIRQWQLYDAEGGRTYVPLRSAGTYVDLAPRPEEIPESLLADLRGCHVAPMRLDIQAALVEWARERGAKVSVDPHFDSIEGQQDAWRSLLPEIDLFLPSREEATSLLGDWPGLERATRELASWGASAVCVKAGAEGAFLCRAGDGAGFRVPSAVESLVDATGCGDAFCGGMLVGWLKSGDLVVGALQGAVSASFVAEGYGAEHALRADRSGARRRLQELMLAVA
jgi:sugar/nucleoside kinase (ribokinase family)